MMPERYVWLAAALLLGCPTAASAGVAAGYARGPVA